MNYRRVVRISALAKVAASLTAGAVALAGCARETTTEPTGAPTCAVVADGSPTAKGYRADMTAVRTGSYAVVTANPLATQAACEVLRDGGTAADALVTAQAVLGLVEPQSSGVGGGGFLLYYEAATGAVQAYDGRETAPAAATENYLRWVSDTDRTAPKPDARASGRSIGVPGIVRLLAEVHREHGRTGWRELFDPAVAMADRGFDVSARLASAIGAAAAQLAVDPQAAEYFLAADGAPKPAGTRLVNPAYAKTLGAIASDPQSFYTGAIARDIVATAADASGGRTPSLMTVDDLAAYTVKKREPLCTPYRGHEICGMPPPSSGGIAVAATLGMLEHFPMAEHKPTDVDLNGGRPTVMGVHLVAEAERLAYADRDRYVADTDFVALPGGSPQTLLGSDYLAGRAALISAQRTMGTAQPGEFGAPGAPAPAVPEHGTSHISIVDAEGNAASLTTTVESPFGSFHMVDGFILNNQLTDFSAAPAAPDGAPVANRVQPGKRPRSTMAPTLVFDQAPAGTPERRGPLSAVVGSPGGSMIIQFVVKTLVGMLDWGLDSQQAASMVDFGAANTPTTNVGGEHPVIDTADDGEHDPLVRGLRALGHQVDLADQSSGLSVVVRDRAGLIGGADPRREGVVMGDGT
ncbi:gamma-glutamyltransferase family protein [Mycolicibacterium holsaticum]|uniref:gamma-glutamyltransferase family protein n=1 Tax=Mycolicibacterium holsaticum TaxID=152142 RepID=UPI001C7D2783|nr:gamma-glutamyltransferase family protein [Mycolicibacterium holsaticum]MDA4109544.1 gamma-glutamyltransferase [Mycolicibacterium holsaticum DSM 44478 = JCM 12374]QZA10481.1 gamma-glutamyltransferase family protein [Mycolicibacterium holsaticum DSM 44478 = JCM 12374]UNC12015.1 gamma-glutamyltransferase family protein [Mycolicibacterium holsaticum DSM 44478 = JCM 12374]